jgi:hypothetical protein
VSGNREVGPLLCKRLLTSGTYSSARYFHLCSKALIACVALPGLFILMRQKQN